MTSLDLLFHHGIDLKNGIVDLTGPVDEIMYKRVSMALSVFADHELPCITYMMNTEGGFQCHAMAIYDLIKNMAGPSKIICNGEVCSAGPLILQAADERVAMPNCQFLVHYGEDTSDSTTTAAHNRRMTHLMRDILLDRAKVKKQTVTRWLSKESWFNAEEALKVGLIDRIYGEDNGPS